MMQPHVHITCTQALHFCDLLALGPELLCVVALLSSAIHKSHILLLLFFFLFSNETEFGFSPLMGLCSLPA